MTNRLSRLALLIATTLLVVLTASRASAPARPRAELYAAGLSAGTEGRWPEAFVCYDGLFRLDPGYRDVLARLDEAARHTLSAIPAGMSLETEIRLLRWFARAGYHAELAEALDRSMIPVPPGEFTMGDDGADPEERPQRLVYLDGFAIDRYEVTNVQYRRFMQETGHAPPSYWSGDRYPPGQADYPVVGVHWEDAHAYCTWAGKRLPTEAEWERACRSTDARTYPWGDGWHPARANVGLDAEEPWPAGITDAWTLLDNVPGTTGELGLRPVGSYPAGRSPDGVLDLVGNVEEWVADWYNPTAYRHLPAHNPLATGPEWARAIRGSAWVYRRGFEAWVADLSRCSARNGSHAYLHPRVGFRCARSMP